MASEFNAFRHIDKTTVVLYALLTVFGVMNIYSASVTPDQLTVFDFHYRSGMQIIWITVSLLAAVVILFMNSNFFSQFTPALYVGIVVLLVATIFLSHDIKGSRSWLTIGSFGVQPAEFAKMITALAVAKCMGQYGFRLQRAIDYIRVIGLFAVPMVIIVLQHETGSALVYLAFLLVLYREGMPGIIPLMGFLAVALFVVTIRFSDMLFLGLADMPVGVIAALVVVYLLAMAFTAYYRHDWWSVLGMGVALVVVSGAGVALNLTIRRVNMVYVMLGLDGAAMLYLLIMAAVRYRREYLLIAAFVLIGAGISFSSGYLFEHVLQAHQQSRIKVAFGMVDDPRGVGYNTRQAEIAIGSGRLWGKGYMQGTQTRLKYVPEQDTDFIFCTIGEEWGFVGSSALILVYVLLMWRIVKMAERAEESFVRVYAYGVLGIILFHFVINIGMVIGIMPVIGIPLPFVSYGGSSFLGFTLMLATLLRLDAMREERLR